MVEKKNTQLFLKLYNSEKDNYGFSEAEYNSLKEKKYIVDDFNIQHDAFWSLLIEEYKNCSKEKVVCFFLNSLETHNLSHRVAISAFSIMTHCVAHKYESKNREEFTEDTYNYLSHGGCVICGVPFAEKILPTLYNYMLFRGVNAHSFRAIYCYLKKVNSFEEQNLCKDSIQIFSDIMDTIVASDLEETPTDVQKKLKSIKIFKSNETERRELLDTLGYLSILETKEHKGFFTKYNKLGHTPRKTRSSDWAYPVDFWTGKDGINKGAFKFWFGEYKELERFWK